MDIKWGLQEPPMPRYLFVGEVVKEGRTALWYEFNHDTEEQIPVFERALIGTLGNLVLHIKEHKGKKAIKLDVTFQTPDETFVVRAGVDTNFMKTFLLAIDQVNDFTKPLTLVLQPGRDGKVIFSAVHYTETNLRIKYEWQEEVSLLPIINKVQRMLGVNVTKVSKDWEIVVVDEAPQKEEEPEESGKTDPQGNEEESMTEQPTLLEEEPPVEVITEEAEADEAEDKEKSKRRTSKKK